VHELLSEIRPALARAIPDADAPAIPAFGGIQAVT
jgi:hypothetical protein